MARFIARRIGWLFVTLLITSGIIFVITQIIPGDIARVILGREAGRQAIQHLREKLGLNAPIYVQYVRWLFNFVTGNWGTSYALQTPILPLVLHRLRNSLMLGGVSLVMAVPLGVALGVGAGLNEGRALDAVVSTGTLTFVGLPEFVTGVILIQLLAFDLGILPPNSSIPPHATFFQALPELILPAVTSTLVLLAYLARLTRAGVIEELKRPYVRAASLKGLPRRVVIVKHVLRNALMPTVTVIAISFGWMISGLIVVENVFNYPGLGRLLAFAVSHRDIPLIQAISMLTAAGYSLANLLADIVYGLLDPRVRVRGRRTTT